MIDEEKIQLGAILEIVQQMQGTMATKDDIASVRSEMATKDDIASVRSEMATKDDIAAIHEDIEFIKDSMSTKEDLRETESRLMTHIDGFAQQNRKFDQELVAARSQFNRVEERVEVLELKAGVSV